ncbi:Alpha/Beta hydrolase fold containing protein [Trema orientale]|uniref:Alpha/Beta hydrolase fold containing protein n=1 Tax=Trema orientale TaxID=63057 RepID=A0A2P5FY48_TREOI|nr:Alpha/Beta hydrolase fold containing protein [Trema orientale]
MSVCDVLVVFSYKSIILVVIIKLIDAMKLVPRASGVLHLSDRNEKRGGRSLIKLGSQNSKPKGEHGSSKSRQGRETSDKVVLVGHSLGGLSLALAMDKFPEETLGHSVLDSPFAGYHSSAIILYRSVSTICNKAIKIQNKAKFK